MKTNYLAQQVLVLAIYLLIGLSCGLLMVSYSNAHFEADSPLWQSLLFLGLMLCAMYLALFLQIILHEVGHLVFGLLTGYQFYSFRFMNLMLVKENGSLHFRQLAIAGTGGQCLMSPPDYREGHFPYLLYNLGGSLMNLLTALLAFGLSYLCPADSIPTVALRMFAAIGLCFALLNALPMRTNTVDTDGYNALSLLRCPDAVLAFYHQLKISEQTALGLRLKDMPAEWFTMPSDEALSNNMEATIGVLSCNRLIDEHRFEEAARQMEHLLSVSTGLIGLYHGLLRADLLYCELIGAKRPERLEELMDDELRRILKTMRRYPAVLRTEYAYALLAEDKPEKAGRILEIFEQCAASYPYPADIQAERSLIDLAAACSQKDAAAQS